MDSKSCKIPRNDYENGLIIWCVTLYTLVVNITQIESRENRGKIIALGYRTSENVYIPLAFQ